MSKSCFSQNHSHPTFERVGIFTDQSIGKRKTIADRDSVKSSADVSAKLQKSGALGSGGFLIGIYGVDILVTNKQQNTIWKRADIDNNISCKMKKGAVNGDPVSRVRAASHGLLRDRARPRRWIQWMRGL